MVYLKISSVAWCRVFDEARPILEKVSRTGKTAAAKAAAAEALAVLAFVGGEDPGSIDSIMTHLTGLWKGALVCIINQQQAAIVSSSWAVRIFAWMQLSR